MTDRMKDVDQTHPETNRTFGFAVYTRGLAADGGRENPDEPMTAVDQDSPVAGTDRSFERGPLDE